MKPTIGSGIQRPTIDREPDRSSAASAKRMAASDRTMDCGLTQSGPSFFHIELSVALSGRPERIPSTNRGGALIALLCVFDNPRVLRYPHHRPVTVAIAKTEKSTNQKDCVPTPFAQTAHTISDTNHPNVEEPHRDRRASDGIVVTPTRDSFITSKLCRYRSHVSVTTSTTADIGKSGPKSSTFWATSLLPVAKISSTAPTTRVDPKTPTHPIRVTSHRVMKVDAGKDSLVPDLVWYMLSPSVLAPRRFEELDHTKR